jgi:CBS domain-containing protein
MLRLRDIMTTDVVTVHPDLSVRDAMELLSSRHVSGAPVVDQHGVVGVVSATDLLAFAASLSGAPAPREERGWSEIEAGGDVSDGDEPDASFFTELWSGEGPDVSVRFGDTGGPEWNALDEHTVAEAMTRAPIRAMAPDTFVTVAAASMKEAEIHRLLVMQGSELLGIVTTTDIARAVAEGKLTTHTLVFGRERDFDERGWRTEEDK